MITVQHQVDSRARSDFQAFEARRQAPVRQPQHRANEVAGTAGLVGLRRPVQPGQKFSLMHVDRGGNDCGIVDALSPVIDRGQRCCHAFEVQRMKPARQPQRQGISQWRASPAAHSIQQRPALARFQQIAYRSADSRGDVGTRCSTIGRLIVECSHHRARAGGGNVGELIDLGYLRCSLPFSALHRKGARYAKRADICRAQGPHPG